MTGSARVTTGTHRLIASRFPTVGVFDDLTADPADLAIAFLLESATNDRLSVLSRRLPLLPATEIVQGPGATQVMAAFLHADEIGGRFTDGRLGAWYASLDVETAIAETVHHNTRRLRLSENGFPSSIQMRELVARIDCDLTDIRGARAARPDFMILTTTRSRAPSASVYVGRRAVRRETGSSLTAYAAQAESMFASIGRLWSGCPSTKPITTSIVGTRAARSACSS